jgi:hypothetical protein
MPKNTAEMRCFCLDSFPANPAFKSRVTLSSKEAKNGFWKGFEKYFHFF